MLATVVTDPMDNILFKCIMQQFEAEGTVCIHSMAGLRARMQWEQHG